MHLKNKMLWFISKSIIQKPNKTMQEELYSVQEYITDLHLCTFSQEDDYQYLRQPECAKNLQNKNIRHSC